MKKTAWLVASLIGTTLLVVAIVVSIDFASRPGSDVRAHPNEPEPTALWVPNAVVKDVLPMGDSYYIAGSFTFMGPFTGAGVPLDATSGAVMQPYALVSPMLPGSVGALQTVISDGSGGWYVGGAVEEIAGQSRDTIAHILGNGGLDGDFTIGTDGYVLSLLLNGTTLYVGGDFSTVGGQAREGLAAIDLTSGTVTNWNPSIEVDADVTSMVLDGTTLYVGGDFTSIDGDPRNRLAAIDTTNSTPGSYLTAWDPNVDAVVRAMVLNGTTLYVGGEFSTVDGATRNRLAAVDTATTTPGTYATAWDPAPDGSGINALVMSGSTVYAGGNFNNIGGEARARLAALDATGAATAFDANIDSTGGNVYSLALSGTDLYIGGDFITVDTELRPFLAKVDTSGALQAWNPSGCDTVRGLAVQSGVVFAAGNFPCMGSVQRFGLAQLDKATGVPTSWAPTTEPALALDAITTDGSSILLGGSFTSIGGTPRNNIAALDPTTGAVTSWDPNANGRVIDLEYRDGALYVAGSFTAIGGQTRNRIAALDAVTGLATSWDPNSNGRVTDIEMAENTMYVSSGTGFGPGTFSSIGGQARLRLAELDLTTGLATDWNPSPNSTVQSVAYDGTTVYAGGLFSNIGGDFRSFLAAIDPVTGLATSWNPGADASVTEVDVYDGILYVGGNFTTLAGQSRRLLASFDASTGELSPWNPQGFAGGSADNSVTVFQTASPVLLVGGDFDLSGLGQSNLKLFSLTTVEWATNLLSGPAQSSQVDLPVTMSAAEASDVQVSYEATGGTAVQGQDYQLTPGTFTIESGETTGTIPLTILENSTEQDKTIEVTLSNPSLNALLGDTIVLTYVIEGSAADPIIRIPGSTPQQQSVSVSQQRFQTAGSAGGAILARTDVAVDSFTSGPLANRTDSTLLLTNSAQLDQVVIDELQRALQGTDKPIYLAGGEVALQSAVKTKLEQLGYTNIKRFDGADRRQTARLAADEIVAKNTVAATKLFLSEGEALVDALATGAVAGRDPQNQQVLPILVTRRSADALDQNVIDFLTANPAFTEVEIVGGTVAVSAAAEAELKQRFPTLTVNRTAGEDRFSTNIAVVSKNYSNPTAAMVARGDRGGIPGALTAQSIGEQDETTHFFSALLASTQAADQLIPLLLVEPTSVPSVIANYISAQSALGTIYIVGSIDQINQAVEDHLRALIQ
jgi:putative cell wall-binding protein